MSCSLITPSLGYRKFIFSRLFKVPWTYLFNKKFPLSMKIKVQVLLKCSMELKTHKCREFQLLLMLVSSTSKCFLYFYFSLNLSVLYSFNGSSNHMLNNSNVYNRVIQIHVYIKNCIKRSLKYFNWKI